MSSYHMKEPNSLGEYRCQLERGVLPLRLYVAGPMTGYPNHNYAAFRRAAEELATITTGGQPEYAVKLPMEPGDLDEEGRPTMPWEEYMARDLGYVRNAHAVLLLGGWTESRGATLEAFVATALGTPCFVRSARLDYWHRIPEKDVVRAYGRVHGKPAQAPEPAEVASATARAQERRHRRVLATGTPERFREKMESAARTVKALAADADSASTEELEAAERILERVGPENTERSGGTRFSAGKPGGWWFLPLYGLRLLSKVGEAGAKKYAPLDWREGQSFSVLLDCMTRHVLEVLTHGPWAKDPETDAYHLAAVAWNALALLSFMALDRRDLDDVTPFHGVNTAALVAAREDAQERGLTVAEVLAEGRAA